MSTRTVIRVSSLSGYDDCRRRGATRLFWRDIKDAGFRLRWLGRGIAASIGTAVHKAASVELAEKAKTGALPPASVARDVGRDELAEQRRSGEITFDGPRGVTHNWLDAFGQVDAMAATYHSTLAPQIEPIIVEERLEAEIETDLVLSGQPDLVCREPGMIRDLKTGTRPPASFVPQLGGYALLARTHGYDITQAAIDFLQRVGTGQAQPEPVTKRAVIEHAETAASNILRNIAADIETFRNGDERRRIAPGDPWAFSANPSSVLCSAKYCSAYGTEFCHEGVAAHG